MDKSILTDTLDTIKERLSSPVFGTFFISFLLCNWEIPVGIFLPLEQLKAMCYTSYFDLIQTNTRFHNFIVPVLITLFYVGVMPWIKNYLIAWNNLSEKSSDNWFLDKAKAVSIPFNKYFTLRQEHESNLEQLKKIIESESKYQAEKFELEEKISAYELVIDEYKKNEKFTDIIYYQGNWLINNLLGDGSKDEKYFIDNSRFHPIISERKTEHVAILKSVAQNIQRGEIYLIVINLKDNKVIVHQLNIEKEQKELVGNIIGNRLNENEKSSSFLKL